MGKMSKELIEYIGIDNYKCNNISNFTQFNVNKVISIPLEMADINEIVKVWVDYNIIHHEFIKTPIGKSQEGQVLTGNKVFISADLNFKIEYEGITRSNNVNITKYKMPISTHITINEKFNSYISKHPYLIIEDVYCEKIDFRSLYLNTTIIAVVDTD